MYGCGTGTLTGTATGLSTGTGIYKTNVNAIYIRLTHNRVTTYWSINWDLHWITDWFLNNYWVGSFNLE